MDSFLSPSPPHDLQEGREPGMPSDSNSETTVGNPSADQLSLGDRLVQQSRDMTGRPDQVGEFNNPVGTETREAQREYGPHPMALSTAQWSLSHQYARSDHATYLNSTTNMSEWATKPCMTNQSSGSDPTSTTFSNDGQTATQNSTLHEIRANPARVQPRGTLPRNQEQRQSTSTEVGRVTSGPNGRTIGVVFENRKFACVMDACNGTTFSRRAELERHYRERHDPNRQDLWCHIPTCESYRLNGGKAFTRPDKFRKHMRDKHNCYL
ncbi:uncharacterized protein yc1106_09562 [Curvularia clavata]|uniref:C2H2-type domain-containing protein n=1 Tax=Curvularia clavata TaxID=95742 RepID=A0A9Q8ZKD6_CURCL|nr:uncharacterized protein yc1106_09562 [Curvularia clavata]